MKEDNSGGSAAEIAALRSKVSQLETQVQTANFQIANLSRHILDRNSSLERLTETLKSSIESTAQK